MRKHQKSAIENNDIEVKLQHTGSGNLTGSKYWN
jgi:hypothetical protein